MKVLSIDLDYAVLEDDMHHQHDMVVEHGIADHPLAVWKILEELDRDFDYSRIDVRGMKYMIDIFKKALENCTDVDFGYDHDNILYRLEKDDADNIDLLNIDNHGDILNLEGYECFGPPEYAAKKEREYLQKYNDVTEGSWVSWLNEKRKLNSYTFICDSGFVPSGPETSIKGYGGVHSRYEYKFEDYDFDYIFVCLSPMYVHYKNWKYFKEMIDMYENKTGKKANVIDRKYEITARSKLLNKYIGISE